jgi:hypothetical protein
MASNASAASIAIANYTMEDVAFTVAETGEKPRAHSIPAHHVLPIPISGPADLKLSFEGKASAFRVEPYNAYVLVPDKAAGVRIEGLELPGQAPDADAKPERNPVPRAPVNIPVKLLVDDVDPRADALWQGEVRKRFENAAAILELQTGFHFSFAGFEIWTSDPNAKDLSAQLKVFEAAVKVKQGTMAVGFTSRKLDDNQKDFGICQGMGASHILVREWRPKGEPERLEVLVRYLAASLGAVSSPDPGSVMRAKLGDGKALHTRFVIRLDPLNVLALNLLADQRRLGTSLLDAIPMPDRVRILRVYSALLQASPGDPQAIDYINALEKDIAKLADPKNANAAGKNEPLRVAGRAKRTEAIRTVIKAIVERAKANAGPTALGGDDLTAVLLRAAAEAAQNLDEVDRGSALLLGIGIAFDDGNSLRDDPLVASGVADVESEAERRERMAALGNPTVQFRRDLCRRFAIGCGEGELLNATAAENSAIGRSQFDQHRAAGLSFPALAAEFAGISFARAVRDNPEAVLKRLRSRFTLADLVPQTRGLRDGLGSEKFEDDFGGTNDERFRAVLAEIRKRVQSLPPLVLDP